MFGCSVGCNVCMMLRFVSLYDSSVFELLVSRLFVSFIVMVLLCGWNVYLSMWWLWLVKKLIVWCVCRLLSVCGKLWCVI